MNAEGSRIVEAMLDAQNVAAEYYDGMGDPLYALHSAFALVVYGSADTGSAARWAGRDAAEIGDPASVAFDDLADALEPMLKELSSLAEDAMLAGYDVYDVVARETDAYLDRLGITHESAVVERGWSRGPRVSVLLAH